MLIIFLNLHVYFYFMISNFQSGTCEVVTYKGKDLKGAKIERYERKCTSEANTEVSEGCVDVNGDVSLKYKNFHIFNGLP